MKVLFVLAVVCMTCQAEQLNVEAVQKFLQKLKNVARDCSVLAHASEADLDALRQHTIPTTQEGKCLMFCIHKKFNIQNDDGSINQEGTTAILGRLKIRSPELYEKVAAAYTTCAGTVQGNSDPCNYSANLAECVFTQSKSLGLFDLLAIV